ncbi:hypothetical protein [Frankia sp. Cr2]|uniref:hypothetical protein n=1 Tax=Frankia sp. Cr2 TaxID=3073932 RepID=UPI002AD1F61F|nr:hypothetical protein [Frankia sp. Cr2]
MSSGLTAKRPHMAEHIPLRGIPTGINRIGRSDRAGRVALMGNVVGHKAANVKDELATASGGVSRRVRGARSAAELSAQRARGATDLQLTKARSRRAVKREAKARLHAEEAQAVLEKRLVKAEHQLERVHRRRHRSVMTLVLIGAGAAAAAAVRTALRPIATGQPTTGAAPSPPSLKPDRSDKP